MFEYLLVKSFLKCGAFGAICFTIGYIIVKIDECDNLTKEHSDDIDYLSFRLKKCEEFMDLHKNNELKK